jgi:hypothetical protein
MPIDELRKITGKNFFWARTNICPYLYAHEADQLRSAAAKHL